MAGGGSWPRGAERFHAFSLAGGEGRARPCWRRPATCDILLAWGQRRAPPRRLPSAAWNVLARGQRRARPFWRRPAACDILLAWGQRRAPPRRPSAIGVILLAREQWSARPCRLPSAARVVLLAGGQRCARPCRLPSAAWVVLLAREQWSARPCRIPSAIGLVLLARGRRRARPSARRPHSARPLADAPDHLLALKSHRAASCVPHRASWKNVRATSYHGFFSAAYYKRSHGVLRRNQVRSRVRLRPSFSAALQ